MKILLPILFVLIGFSHISGQQVVSSGGQSGFGNQIQASATIGEAIIGSQSNGNLNSNQGFQQPLQRDITSTIDLGSGNTIDVKIGPNPAFHNLNIQLSQVLQCDIAIYDNLGRTVLKTSINDAVLSQSIDISTLKSGTYIMHFTDAKRRNLTSVPLIKI